MVVNATGGGGYGHLEEIGYGHGGLEGAGGLELGGYEGNEIGHDVGGGHHEEFVDYYVSRQINFISSGRVNKLNLTRALFDL